MTYAIYEGFFPDVEKKLNHIAKKCAKHGNDFTFKINGEEIREIKDSKTDLLEYYNFILVEVEGTAKIENWECVAVLEVNQVGNIIRRINTDMEIPDRFRHSENICEHCQSLRHRNNLYIIHNTVTDEWKQVGGNCLKLYTGGLDMEYVTAWLDGITELEEAEEDSRERIEGGKPYYKVEEVLAFATDVVGKIGYYNSQSNLPTKVLVSKLVTERTDIAIFDINEILRQCKFGVRFSEDDFGKDETKALVENIIQYYMNIEDDSEFSHNIKVILTSGYANEKHIGYLSYLPEGYNKYIQKQAEKIKKAEALAKIEYFGEVGNRYKDEKIHSVEMVASWETSYGRTHIYKIMLENGVILTWKTSNPLYKNPDEEYDKITFTIKSHTEYRGEKQTEVTRCKIATKKMEEKG